MRNRLLALYGANRDKGARLRAEAGSEHTIYLYDFIAGSREEADWWGGVSPDMLIEALAATGGGPVTLRVNSPGGDVFGGRAMQQAIAAHPGQVTVIVDGLAASAASYLIQAADRIQMAEGAMLMIHKAWSVAIGNADDMMATAGTLEKIDSTLVETYEASAKRRGVKMTDFAALMAAETWLTRDEAIEVGLADEHAPTKAQARAWDLSAYANAPEIVIADEAAPEPAIEEPEDHSNEIERRRRIASAFALTAA